MTGRKAPALDDRSLGWLGYLHRKATTPDNWDRDGQPHPHWNSSWMVVATCCIGVETGSGDLTKTWLDGRLPKGRLRSTGCLSLSPGASA
jgi:hypothetical protein